MRLKRLGWNTAITRSPAVAAVPRGGDDGGDLRRQVGVVVDERRPAVDAADVEAAGHAAEAGERRRRRRTARRALVAIAIAPMALTTLCTPRSGRRTVAEAVAVVLDGEAERTAVGPDVDGRGTSAPSASP